MENIVPTSPLSLICDQEHGLVELLYQIIMVVLVQNHGFLVRLLGISITIQLFLLDICNLRGPRRMEVVSYKILSIPLHFFLRHLRAGDRK
jgi:hypothetical protein